MITKTAQSDLLRLAPGAEVAAAASHNYPLNRSAAARTVFSTTMGNPKLELGAAELAAGAQICAHAGTLITNS